MTQPDFIGSYVAGGATQFYAVSAAEIDRAGFSLARVLRSFAFAPGSNLLTISMVPEIYQYGGFERAVQMLGLYGLNADNSPFDAARVESITRQFALVAICGVAKATLDGLAALGHDAARIFAGRVVWARPDAYMAVAAMPGVRAHRVVSLGPALALECAFGSLHLDSREWTVTAPGETLVIASRLPRCEPLAGIDLGIVGRLGTAACRCGARDATVEVQ